MSFDKLLDNLDKDRLSRRSLLKAGALATAGIAGASLAGCTGSTPAATPTTAIKPTEAPLATKELVKVGYLPSDHQSSLFVAQSNGYFDKYGIKVEETRFDAGAKILQQIAAGTIDIGLVGVPSIIMYIDKGTPLKIVAPVHTNGSGIIVRNDVEVNSIADLKGKKVAIPAQASIQDIYLRELLAKNNIDYSKDLNVVTVPAGQIVGSLTAKSIDAAFPWEPYVTMAVKQNVAKVLAWTNDLFPGHPCCAVAASADLIKNYPGSVQAFLQAHKAGTEFVNGNLEKTAEIVSSKDWLNLDTSIEDSSLTHMNFIYKPTEAYLAGTEKFATDLKALGSVTGDHNRSDLFDLSILNTIG